jgi:ubiquinone/menaquinone biosynthesis C-methylase UbiE
VQAEEGAGSQSAQAAQRQFGAIAAAYATSAVHASGEDLQVLIETADLNGSESALDLGCGAGHTALALARHARDVVAADVTPEMLQVAQQLAGQRGLTNVRFQEADATDLPFEPASFDLVTSRYSAHHFPDPARAAAEVARVLRPGGRFLLADTVAPEAPLFDTFCNAVELLRDPSHVRNARITEWERILRAAGLEFALIWRSTLELEGSGWIQRSHTSSQMVDAIRTLFRDAPPSVREAFALRDGTAWGWTIPIAVLSGRK